MKRLNKISILRGLLPASLLLALLGVTPAIAEESPSQELWYRLEVDGSPAGWMVTREFRGGEHLTTVSILNLRFRRGGLAQSIELASRFVETHEGRPVSAWSKQTLGPAPMETTYEFQKGTVLARGPGGEEQRLPWPEGAWLSPGRAQEELVRLLGSDAERFEIRTLDPQLGIQPVTTTWSLVARDVEIAAGAERRRASHWKQSQDFAPQVVSEIYLDAEGIPVKSTTPILGLVMTMTLASRDEVLVEGEPPELLVQTFLYPDKPIERPRETTRAVYRIHVEDGPVPELPSVGNQRVERLEDGVRVSVELGSSPRLGTAEQPVVEPLLRPSAYLAHRDPALRRLVTEATRGAGKDAAARAEAIRAFVHGYLTEKDLGSVLATASEVAASRSGDCTEHSVLTTALLRGDGIPARVVTGLVYVDRFVGQSRFFGYHMWSQAWIDGRWVDLDATLAVPFDAAHITLGTASLNDGEAPLADLAQFATLVGRARIEVLELARGGLR